MLLSFANIIPPFRVSWARYFVIGHCFLTKCSFNFIKIQWQRNTNSMNEWQGRCTVLYKRFRRFLLQRSIVRLCESASEIILPEPCSPTPFLSLQPGYINGSTLTILKVTSSGDWGREHPASFVLLLGVDYEARLIVDSRLGPRYARCI